MTNQIVNGVEKCHHHDAISRISNSVLFAGRLNQKGLELTIQSIKRSKKSMHLFVAGSSDLENVCKEMLSPNAFTYLGLLNRDELLEFIHKVEFVSAISQYYDNYPTIALEALTHGAIPITTSITGVSSLLRYISPDLVIDPKDLIPFDDYSYSILHQKIPKMDELDLNLQKSRYLEIFNSVL